MSEQEYRVAGHEIRINSTAVRAAARGHHPEPIRRHWVNVDGVRFPPKQLFELCTGIPRSTFISHQALRTFQRLGFETSEIPGSSPHESPRQQTATRSSADRAHPSPDAIQHAAATLAQFMHQSSLTERIAQIEHELVGATTADVAAIADAHAISNDMLASALTIRRAFGRVNDVIHAAVISLALKEVLEPGEQIVNRPSLAAGNDPSRPFDVETDRRVAEFKVSIWTGKDAMRKRGAFADLVHLALDDTGRRQQLFIVGTAPKHFLETTAASADWGLNRSSPLLRGRYKQRFGTLETAIADVRARHARDVEIIDLLDVIPGIDKMLTGGWS